MKIAIPLFLATVLKSSPVFGTDPTCETPNSQQYDLELGPGNNVVGSVTVTELDLDTLKVCFELDAGVDLTPGFPGDDNSPTEVTEVSISVGCSASTESETVSYGSGAGLPLSGCKHLPTPDCPYHTPIDVSVEVDMKKLGGFEFMHDYFPISVEYRNHLDGSGGADDSYLDVTFQDGPFAGFKIDTWCIDIDNTIGNAVYTGTAVSGYDANLEALAPNVDDTTRLSCASWLINNYKVGDDYSIDYKGTIPTTSLCPYDFPDGPGIPSDVQDHLDDLAFGDPGVLTETLNEGTLQRALWFLIDDGQSTNGITPYKNRLACWLAWKSLQHCDYQPSCGDLIPIVLVPDGNHQTLTAQTTFAALEIPCTTITATAEVSDTFEMTCQPECEPGSGPVVGVVVGDPHIYTFDGLTNDCQANGEFVLFKTPGTTRQMNALFEHFTAQGFWSVTKAFAVQDYGHPKVEIVVPVLGNSPVSGTVGGCDLIFLVDGVKRDFDDGSGSATVDVTADSSEAVIEFSTGMKVTVTTAYANGCFLNLVVELPCADPSTIGLMGTPNGDPMDDWMTSSGSPIVVPSHFGARSSEEGYEYCTENWCVDQSQDSMLTYPESGLDFDHYNLCNLPFGGTAISEADPAILAFCGTDPICITDGVVGGLAAAQASVLARQAIAQTCNALGGECDVAECCGDLACATMDGGEKQCVEPKACPGCAPLTSGSCINDDNSVCYDLNSDGSCQQGTVMCHHLNIDERTADAGSAIVYEECTGCWGATSGVCKGHDTVCYGLDGTGACPNGSNPCEARRRLRGV